jgi:hypothetical protein
MLGGSIFWVMLRILANELPVRQHFERRPYAAFKYQETGEFANADFDATIGAGLAHYTKLHTRKMRRGRQLRPAGQRYELTVRLAFIVSKLLVLPLTPRFHECDCPRGHAV